MIFIPKILHLQPYYCTLNMIPQLLPYSPSMLKQPLQIKTNQIYRIQRIIVVGIAVLIFRNTLHSYIDTWASTK